MALVRIFFSVAAPTTRSGPNIQPRSQGKPSAQPEGLSASEPVRFAPHYGLDLSRLRRSIAKVREASQIILRSSCTHCHFGSGLLNDRATRLFLWDASGPQPIAPFYAQWCWSIRDFAKARRSLQSADLDSVRASPIGTSLIWLVC